MTLPDGTSVWLSPQSRIKIPNEFNRKNRMVELNGEGYFEVTKDDKKPFTVKTQQFNIQAPLQSESAITNIVTAEYLPMPPKKANLKLAS